MLSEPEQERFLRLWAEAQPAVAGFVHAVVRDSAAAKDLLQETALVLFRRFADYDGERPFLAWALGVAKFQVLGFQRDEARSLVTFDTELFDQFAEAWTEQAPTASAQSAALEVCLQRMAARPRQILRWRYFEDLKSEEIARRLGTEAVAVRVALQRLREKLRVCVEKQMRSAQVSASTPALQAGRLVPTGRIVLVAGAVELVLRNGVNIVFEGPGDLELVTPMRALLHSGQAVVRVPGGAKGFQLQTATAQVVDLGTEFGVKCGPGGVSDILVFDGKVVASALGGSAAFPRQLTAGMATRFAPDQPNPAQIAYRPERFVRQLPLDRPVELDEPGSPLFNLARHEEIVVSRLERPLAIDGDLSDWSDVHSFRSARNEVAGEFVEGRMRYDEEFLYLAAHIGDPAPMRNVVDPATDGELGWRGGGLQVRLATDSALGWPAEGNSAAYYTMRRLSTDEAQVARATNSHLVHLTLWHHAPTAQGCLHLAWGMDLHGEQVNPPGYRAAYRKDANGRGYTLEYAIPWALLNAPRAPQPGETLAMSWTAHWSDQGGRLWRGQWVELRNSAEPLRIHTWERAATWGRAVFR